MGHSWPCTPFWGFPDPIAEVDVRQAAAPRLLHLPQHGINPEPARFLVRIVKGVHRRQAVGQVIDHGHGQQPAVQPHFVEHRVDAAGGEKVEVFLRIGIVHAAARMPARLIARVERKMLGRKHRRVRAHLEVLVAPPDAFLATAGLETRHRDAHRYARTACAAVRPVDEVAAAPETEARKAGVGLAVEFLARIEKQR